MNMHDPNVGRGYRRRRERNYMPWFALALILFAVCLYGGGALLVMNLFR